MPREGSFRYMIHHHRTISRAKAGQPIMLDTISAAFADARTGRRRSMDSISAPARQASMRCDPWLPGFMKKKGAMRNACSATAPRMTDLYRDSRGAEWIDVA